MKTLLEALIALPLALLFGCGGGGDAAPLEPTAEVAFPAGLSTTNSSTITVAVQSTPGESETAAVRVGGVEARFEPELDVWMAEMPLAVGLNRFEVEIEDVDGNVFGERGEAVVRRGNLFEFVTAIDHDPVDLMAWIVDSGSARLYAVDPFQGGEQLVSGGGVGQGPSFDRPFTVAAEPGTGRVWVADSSLDAIVAVDTQTGDRTILETSGETFSVALLIGGLEFDTIRNQLLFATIEGLIAIDVATGVAQLIAEPLTSSFGVPRDVAVDTNTGEVYMLYRSIALRIDTNTGLHITVASTGDTFSFGNALDVDSKTGTIYVSSRDEFFSIDRATGLQQRIGALEAISGRLGLAFDDANGRMLLTEAGRDRVLTIDPVQQLTGQLAGDGIGDGPGLSRLIELSNREGRIFGLDASFAVFEIDGDAGDRTLVSGRGAGGGDEFDDPTDLLLDLDAGRVLVADGDAGIVVVDLESGDRSTFVPGSVEGGFLNASRLVQHPDGRLFVLDTVLRGVMELDPESGDQRAVSIKGDGKGNDFSFVQAMALDADGDRMFVSDQVSLTSSLIWSVDLDTGLRSVIASEFVGFGVEISQAAGLAFDPKRNALFVGEELDDTVVAILLDTLSRFTFVDNGSEAGPILDSLDFLELDETGHVLFCGSQQHTGLIGISLLSAERVLISK